MPLYSAPKFPLPFGAPSTGWQQPANMLSCAALAPTSGLLTFVPMDVGPAAKAFSALGVGAVVAQVAGTTVTTVGVYRDDGTGGFPNMVGGPIVSGTVVLTAAGNAVFTPASPFTLTPGRYWNAFLYTASVAPTTVATVNAIANAAPNLWLPTAQTIGSTARGLSASGQTALPTTQIVLTPNGASTCVSVAAKAA